MAVTGQLWYSTEGNVEDAHVAYVNSDSNTPTIVVDNDPNVDLVTAFTSDVVLDTAAGLYYVLVDGNEGINAKLLMGHIGSAAPPTVVFTFDPTYAGTENNLHFGLHIDPINERIYVGSIDFVNFDDAHQGVRQLTYNPTTGLVSDNGLIYTQTTASVDPSVAGATPLFIPRDFDIDYTRNVMYAAQFTLGDGFETNTIVRIDLNNLSAPAVPLVSQALFPLDGNGSDFTTLNGIIQDVEVDANSNRVYFTTHAEDVEETTGEDAIWLVANASTASSATPVKLTLLPGAFSALFTTTNFYPGDMVLDEVNDILYVESENSNLVGGGITDIILKFQLSADGLTATLIETINPGFDQTANIEGMTFDQLAVLGALSPTATLATEQVTNLDILTAAPTITDFESDHLNNATVTISGSFLGSGDHLYVLDGTQKISGTFTGTNITISRTTDGSGNQTLTLSGYDTLTNYQNVLNAVGFLANGDNPTNYGNSTTRTISWQVNDGAAGNPSGNVNGATTNVRTTTVTIDAVDDAPVNNSLVAFTGGNSVSEDTGKRVTFSVSDVDADPANQTITVRLQVTNGTITINTGVGGGLAAGGVTGNGTNDVLLTGTQNQINATLANIIGAVYHNTADYNGADTLTVTTNDQNHTGSGGPLTDIDVVNIAINAVVVDIADDTVSVAEDSGANDLDLLANDSFENAGRAITAVGAASHGTVTINDNGSAGDATDDFVVYTPDADYNGADSFTYTVTSGGVTEQATVNVTVNAVADITDDTVSVGEDSGANNLNLLLNDSFEDSGRAITAVGAASHGTVTINDNGSAGDATDDFVVYTPDADYNGADSFTYTVTSGGVTEQATANVTVNAIADIAGDTVSVGEDSGANDLDLLANDSFENAGRAITAVGTASHGTVTINDNGSAGDATDDFVVYTPDADYNGADSFTYTVTSGGVTEQATVNVTVNAVADAANDTAATNQGAAVDVNVLANDSFENADHAITATTDGSNGTVTVDDNSTPVDTTDDFVVYTPNASFHGPDSFTYTVTSGGVTEQATVNVTVRAAPTGITIVGAALAVNEFAAAATLVGQVAGQDPDSSTFTYTLLDDAGGRFNIDNSGNITVESGLLLDFEQNASHNIQVQVTDSNSQSFDTSFSVTVNNVDPETVNGDANANTFVGGDLADTLAGGGNSDTVTGGKGNDHIYGGISTGVDPTDLGDILHGGDDDDFVQGNGGDDEVYGDAGNDQVGGGKGNDKVFGGADNDTLFGGNGLDELHGGTGNDFLYGGNSAISDPTAETDTLFGEEGDDFLQGNGGDDELHGGIGVDNVRGGQGNDEIHGDADNDSLTGGQGIDTFVFLDLDGVDTVTDFADGVDLFDLSGLITGDQNFGELSITDTAGPGVTVDYGSGSFLIANINNISLIDNSDFIFT